MRRGSLGAPRVQRLLFCRAHVRQWTFRVQAVPGEDAVGDEGAQRADGASQRNAEQREQARCCTRDAALRKGMMDAISPFWDGNETWLVVIGAGLFAAFPVVYAVFLGAFYLPIVLLLVGLIFRGVAFEFRYRGSARGLWDWGFFLGSTMAAFVQGAAVGAMMRGIPVVNEQYAGGRFEWLAPFPVITGIGLVFGYALLGAGWLVLKSEGALREWASPRALTSPRPCSSCWRWPQSRRSSNGIG